MDLADALQVFDAVFDGDDEAKGGAVVDGQRLAGHLVGEDGLGMEGAGFVYADIILIVRGTEADVFEGGFLLEAVMVYKIAESHATPPGYLAPAFDAFEFERIFGLGKGF